MRDGVGGGARRLARVVRRAVAQTSRDDCPMLAAGLAFYAVFSLGPLLAIVLHLSSLAVDPDLAAAWVERQAGALVGAEGRTQVHAILSGTSAVRGAGLASVVSAIAAVMGATTVLVQLQRALNRVWQVIPGGRVDLGSFVVKRTISVVIVALSALLLVASLAASAVVAMASRWVADVLPPEITPAARCGLDTGGSLLLFGALFAATYKILPDTEVRWSEVAFGAAVASGLLVLGKVLVGWFLGAAAVATAYGAAGSLAVVLVWVYYAALLLLFGAEISRAWALETRES